MAIFTREAQCLSPFTVITRLLNVWNPAPTPNCLKNSYLSFKMHLLEGLVCHLGRLPHGL